MNTASASNEIEQRLGSRLRQLRILRNLDQRSLALRAGLSLNALKYLESGKGARVNSLVKLLRALDRADWLETLAPTVSNRREPRRVRRRVAAIV